MSDTAMKDAEANITLLEVVTIRFARPLLTRVSYISGYRCADLPHAVNGVLMRRSPVCILPITIGPAQIHKRGYRSLVQEFP